MVSPFFSWKSGCDGDDGAFRGLIMRDTEDAAAAVEKKSREVTTSHFPAKEEEEEAAARSDKSIKGINGKSKLISWESDVCAQYLTFSTVSHFCS